jgi:hypothetical protein
MKEWHKCHRFFSAGSEQRIWTGEVIPLLVIVPSFLCRDILILFRGEAREICVLSKGTDSHQLPG